MNARIPKDYSQKSSEKTLKVISKTDSKRINLNLKARLVDRLDSFAEQKGLNRTSAVSMILSEYLRMHP